MLGIDDQKDLSEKRLKKLIQSHTDDENYFKLFENERKWFELVRKLLVSFKILFVTSTNVKSVRLFYSNLFKGWFSEDSELLVKNSDVSLISMLGFRVHNLIVVPLRS